MQPRSFPATILRATIAVVGAMLLTQGLAIRIASAADVIDPESQTRQPLITLEVDDAALPDVARSLGVAVHRFIGVSPMYKPKAANNQELFTLHAVKQPFWLVYEQLHQQHPILIQVPHPLHGDAMALAPLSAVQPEKPTGELAHMQTIHFHAGDFLVLVDDIARARTGNALQLNWAVMPDPRIRISKATVESLKAVDDAGNKLTSAPGPSPSSPAASRLWMLTANLAEPKTPIGKTAGVDSTIELELNTKQVFKIHVKCESVPIRQ